MSDFPDAMLMRLTVQERAEFVGRLLSCNAIDAVGESVILKPPHDPDKMNFQGVEKSSFNLRLALARLMAHLCGDTSRPLLWAQREAAIDHHVPKDAATVEVHVRRRLYAISM